MPITIPTLEDFRQIVKEELQTLNDKKEQDRYLSIAEVMTMFNIKRQCVYNWRNAGRLVVHKMGTRVFFKKSEIEANIETLSKYSHQ